MSIGPFNLSVKRALVAPEGRAHGANISQILPLHDKEDGWSPSWRWVAPPGIGDAPQHVFTTYALAPISIEGPGDEPAAYLKIVNAPPIIQNFAMRWQGMPVQGGNFLMTGLYTPQPLDSLSNDQFSS